MSSPITTAEEAVTHLLRMRAWHKQHGDVAAAHTLQKAIASLRLRMRQPTSAAADATGTAGQEPV